MLDDKLLISEFKRGKDDAFCRIYEKYKDRLLTVALSLLNDMSTAEDVVHDTFVSFAESIDAFALRGSLRRYLDVCVVNRARNVIKARQVRRSAPGRPVWDPVRPEWSAIRTEEATRVNRALAQLPYEQREVVVLHLKGGMMFREIAAIRSESTNTVQSRYRRGLDRLRWLLNHEVTQ